MAEYLADAEVTERKKAGKYCKNRFYSHVDIVAFIAFLLEALSYWLQ